MGNAAGTGIEHHSALLKVETQGAAEVRPK
jgi:hypothetical protein